MNLPKKAIFIGGGVLVAVVALMLVFSTGSSNKEAEALAPPPGDNHLCFPAPGTIDFQKSVDVTPVNSKFVIGLVTLGLGETYCEPANKAKETDPTPVNPTSLERFRCFEVKDGDYAGLGVNVKTQFHQPKKITVQKLQNICLPASKVGAPGLTPTYACFDVKGITAGDIFNPDHNIKTPNFDANITVLGSDQLCMPATVNNPSTPPDKLPGPEPLLCYDINHHTGNAQALTITTNLAVENVFADFPQQLCVPAVVDNKILPTGNLSGIADILVYLDDKNLQAFYCKARTDHDGATNEVKTDVTCFSDTPGQAAPGDKVPTDPDVDLLGPPPPPPYGNGAPQKGEGFWCAPIKPTPGPTPAPATSTPGPTPTPLTCPNPLGGDPLPDDTLFTVTCFESLGGTLGPNVISVVVIPNAKATLPNQSGLADIYFGQGIDDCKALTPFGDPTQTLPLNIDTYDTPPYDNVTSVDSDGDGCPDAFELDKGRPKKDCGDDPWNPHDSDLDFSGIFTKTIVVIRADTCPGTAGPPPIGCDGAAAGDIVAGSYFNCQGFLDHNMGDNSITGNVFCYPDDPVITVNFEDNGGALVCAPFPSANPEDCGDGLPGSPPPGPFGDNDGTPGTITGFYDDVKNKLFLVTCISTGHPVRGPWLIGQSVIDAHTGLGTMQIWINWPVCKKPDKKTDPPAFKDVPIAVAEQDDGYDVDQDGCNTRQELGTNKFAGGQRDPYNKYDHMDINKDGFINIPDDILPTAALFGTSSKGVQGNVGPRLVGSVPWAHGNGDTAVNIPDDILGMAAQFGHNC